MEHDNKLNRDIQDKDATLSQLVNNLEEVFWLGSPDWQEIYFISKSYERVWGKTCKSMYEDPMSWKESLLPEDRTKAELSIKRIIESGYAVNRFDEYRIARPDGEVRWIQAQAFPVRDQKGNVVKISGIAQDITEQKKLTERLSAARDLLARTGRIGKIGAWEVDCETKELTWSEETYRIHELPSGQRPSIEEAVDFFHPDERPRLVEAIKKAMDHGEPYDMELRFTTAKGKHLWVHSICEPVVVDGRVVKLNGSFQDITEQKKFENNLRESEKNLKEAQRVASIGSWEWKSQEDAVLWSDETYRIFGVTPGEFTPTFERILDFIPEEERTDYKAEVDKAMVLKQKFQYGFNIVTKIGEKKSLMIRGEVNLDDEGRPYGMWGTVQDVTERQKVIRVLEEREKYLDLLLKSMFNAFVLFESVFDEKGDFVSYRFVYINEAYERITGVKEEEVRGRTVHEVWPETEPEWIKRYGEVAVTGKPQTFELYHGPTEKLYYCNVYRPWDNNERFCVVFEDITERKKAEVTLRESEKRYKSLFQDAVDGIFIMEFSPEALEVVRKTKRSGGIFVECNDMMLSIFGAADRDYFLGKSPEDISPPEQPGGKPSYELAYEKLKAAFEGEAQSFEWEHLKQDGTFFYVRVSLNRLELGDDVFLQAILSDITKQKESEEEIKALAKFPSENPFPVMRIKKEGMITYANKAAGSILEKWGIEVGGQVPENWQKLMEESFDPENKNRVEAIEKADGKYYSLSLSPVIEEGYMNIYGLDVTERRKAVKKLAQYQKNLENLVEQRTRDLQAANEELEAFSYSVSHDLRAPLRSMDGFSRAVLEDYKDKLGERGTDYLMRIRRGAQRMGFLIDDLLQLSRISRHDIKIEEVPLSKLVSSVLERLASEDPERKVRISVRPGISARADEHLIRIALENILSNSWKFTSKKPRARIEFDKTEKNGKTVYMICDNGAGFNMKYKDKLFKAFQRLHSEKDYPGTGIGLVIVKRIITKHGGEVWMESEAEKGATVYFTLPEENKEMDQ